MPAAPSPGRPGHPPAPARNRSVVETLNPRYSFNQFIIGDGNRLAHAAALAVAELPGQAYNPLFMHAPPGLGKTHLLHAIGNYVLAFGAGTTVRYTTVEAFTNHFITALGSRSIDHFKRAYRDADVLLIDDVQFLASKAKTEEEFFHTFNALYEDGRQLVLTCDRLPRQLSAVEARLRERFESGLVADIRPPDFATRVAILRKRAAVDHVALTDTSVLDVIAERITHNVRALEGALIRVVAYHSLTGHPIDSYLTTEVLDEIHPSTRPGALSVHGIQAAVAAAYGISVEELTSSSRAVRIAWPRHVAIHLVRELTEVVDDGDRRRVWRAQPCDGPTCVQARIGAPGHRSRSGATGRPPSCIAERRRRRPALLTHLSVLPEQQLARSLRMNTYFSTASIRPMTSTFLLRYSS